MLIVAPGRNADNMNQAAKPAAAQAIPDQNAACSARRGSRSADRPARNEAARASQRTGSSQRSRNRLSTLPTSRAMASWLRATVTSTITANNPKAIEVNTVPRAQSRPATRGRKLTSRTTTISRSITRSTTMEDNASSGGRLLRRLTK